MSMFPLDAERLYFRVDHWTNDGRRVIETLAAACNFDIAMRAFEASTRKETYGHRRLTLREGIKLIREHVPPGMTTPMDIFAILDRYQVPHGFFEAKAVRNGDGATRIHIRDLGGASIDLEPKEAVGLVETMRANGYGDYTLPIDRALEEAKDL